MKIFFKLFLLQFLHVHSIEGMRSMCATGVPFRKKICPYQKIRYMKIGSLLSITNKITMDTILNQFNVILTLVKLNDSLTSSSFFDTVEIQVSKDKVGKDKGNEFFVIKNTHRQEAESSKTLVLKKYDQRHLGGWRIRSVLYKKSYN